MNMYQIIWTNLDKGMCIENPLSEGNSENTSVDVKAQNIQSGVHNPPGLLRMNIRVLSGDEVN